MRALIRDLAKSVYFLDYDGTLCPHLEVWEGRDYNSQDIAGALANLAKKSLGAWWNTGRRVDSMLSVNPEFMKFPGFFIQGSMYWDGQQAHCIGEELPLELAQRLEARMKHEGHYRLEIKPTAGRIASFRKTQRKFLKKYIDALGVELPPQWEWRIGDRGAELLLKGCSKGSALKYAYDQGLVPADAIPVVAGDDVFDRPAMEFALERGGYAVLLGEACGWITEIPHRSSQVVYFREPKDFLQLLKSL